ncbi:MAG: hypothetical protein HDP34_03620 [Clostridia bacterium]|nr:hypothetical protein [Clostridia bacterium]
MKNTLRKILLVVLATLTVVCAAVGLAACGGAKLTGLEIENARLDFKIGDEFETGEGFAVYAVYSDGTREDVTAEAQVAPEKNFDINVYGNYQIVVSWGGKKEIYTVVYSDFDPILRKIEIDSSKVKKDYCLGEDISYDGIKITCTYENAQEQLYTLVVTGVKNFTVEIVSESGHKVYDYFDELGKYTVTLSVGAVKASYEVTAQRVDISSVQTAIATANAFKNKVLSGTYVKRGWMLDYTGKNPNIDPSKEEDKNKPEEERTKPYMTEFNYTYKFGDNYTYLKETQENSGGAEYYFSIEDGEIFCAQFIGGVPVNSNANLSMIDGVPLDLWYNRVHYYGPESVLNALYRAAQACTNKDLKETADEATKTYSFTFSGLVFQSSKDDYYETKVEFRLAEDNILSYLMIDQRAWLENKDNSEGNPPTFNTNVSTGKTTPQGDCSKREISTVTQVSGERTETNPKSPSALILKDYELLYNGKDVSNGVVECNLGNSSQITFQIDFANITPSTASFESDNLMLNYVGSVEDDKKASGDGLFNESFYIYTSNTGTLNVRFNKGGVYTIIFKTQETYKTVTFDVIGNPPTSFTATLGNEKTQLFSPGNEKTVAIGSVIYFRGEPNANADYRQTVAVTSGDASKVTLEEAELGGVKCFTFRASAAGTYVITASSVSSSKQCTFTFTVNDAPDFAAMLTGKYTAHSNMADYTVEFTPDSATQDKVSGTVVITQTDDDGTTTQTLKYDVDFETQTVKLTHVSGTNLGAGIVLNPEGKLALEDWNYKILLLNRA